MLKKLAIVLLAVFLAVMIPAFIYLNTIAKNLIETYGSKIMGTSVTVDLVSISPFSGNIKMTNLQIASPQGFKAEYVFKFSKLDFDIILPSLFSETINITNLKIEEPEIVQEIGFSGYNVNAITSNTRSPSAAGASASKKAKKVSIDKLEIIDGKVTIFSNLAGENANPQLPLPEINLTGIGKRDNGVIISDAVAQILQAIANAISRMDLKVVETKLKDLGERFKDEVKALDELIKK